MKITKLNLKHAVLSNPDIWKEIISFLMRGQDYAALGWLPNDCVNALIAIPEEAEEEDVVIDKLIAYFDTLEKYWVMLNDPKIFGYWQNDFCQLKESIRREVGALW